MFSILIGFVLSRRCAPCLPWPPESKMACAAVCIDISDEQYYNIMKKYKERVQEYYSTKQKDPTINSQTIEEKPLKCYPSHCYISISNPKYRRCTKDCRLKEGKITYIE